MRQSLSFFLLIFSFYCVDAHPSWGIVVDQKGNIIFSDLEHVWQITPDGKLEKRLSGRHTHELYLDAEGILWGTDSEYLSATDEWRNQLWYQQGTELKEAIPWVKGFEEFGGSNFVVQPGGRMVFPYQNQLYQRSHTGETRLYASFKYGRLCTIHGLEDGRILVSDSSEDGKLYQVDTTGQSQLLASGLKELEPENPPLKEARFNLFYGLREKNEQIYLANSGSRRILKIDMDGQFSTFFTSEMPWYPVGICFEKDTTYILEWGFTNTNIGPRILRKTSTSGFKEIYNHQDKVVKLGLIEVPETPRNLQWLWALLLIPLLLLLYRRRKKD